MKKTLKINEDLYLKLKRLARFRGISISKLLLEFLNEIDDAEQNEIGFYDNET